MTDIRRIRGGNGEQFYPQTHKKAILMNSEGQTLDQYLAILESKVNEIDDVVFSKTSSISLSPSVFEFQGLSGSTASQRCTLSFSTSYKGSSIPKTQTSLDSNGIEVENPIYITNVTINLPSNNSVTLNISTDEETWWKTGSATLNVNRTASNGALLYQMAQAISLTIKLSDNSTLNPSATIFQYAPIFMGLCKYQKEESITGSNVIDDLNTNSAVNSKLAIKSYSGTRFSSSVKNFTINADNLSFWIAVPKQFGLPSSYSHLKAPLTMTNDVNKIGKNLVEWRGVQYYLIRNFSDEPLASGNQLSIEVGY